MLRSSTRNSASILKSGKSFFSTTFCLPSETASIRWDPGEAFESHQAFDDIPERNSSSWTTLIASYYREKRFGDVISLFRSFHRCGNERCRSVVLFVLNSCRKLSELCGGKQVHSLVIKSNCASDVVASNVLISMYANCGEAEAALKVFEDMPDRDLVSCTSVLSGFSQNGFASEALDFFIRMHDKGVGFSDYGYCAVLRSCILLKAIRSGMMIHCMVVQTGFQDHAFVASPLVDMYAKCGNITDARQMFDEMQEPGVVSWTSIMACYVQNGDGEEALRLFVDQMRAGVSPDPFSFSCILSGCANLPALDQGRQIHALVTKFGYEMQLFAGNSLIDMYSKCGWLADAKNIHSQMPIKDVVSWSGMISGYAHHGLGAEALHVFELMKEAKVKPNAVTFVCVLSACSHSGLVDEGIKHFDSMTKEFGIERSEEHYTCVIDLLGRAGRLKEAEEFLNEMPFDPGASSWGALLNGCKLKGNVTLGLKCAEQLFRLEPHVGANHVTLANMYASNRRWEDMARVRTMLKDKDVKKDGGYSWTEEAGKVHVFGVDDNLHPQSELIHSILQILYMDLKDSGYVLHLGPA